MNFHTSSDFSDALRAAADHFNLRPVFIEKDYWVTFVLKNLSDSALSADVVFKGGTSLSKAYQCIERFSEDIDLALIKTDGLSANQLKNKLKVVETACSTGLHTCLSTLPRKNSAATAARSTSTQR